eukprot:CAMPEP_0197719470 /NCGR_PEP_ID=MMETSP1434-20131217/3217_1 /TAXON_ID=265543 /ORGANISM="Minutocellus polymorphus, Strain CCMP3303" /LENGTH=139 /DNA_ID=CAMNT_0043304223 /DNA_START=127 /DNA_END=546 /DNA_ORIENTATION=+
MRANAAPGVALEVQSEAYDEVEPVRWQVQDVAGLQDDLVGPSLGELGIELQIRLTPVHRRVPSAGMVLGVEGHFGTLLGMGQDIPPLSTHDGNGIATPIKVILGNHPSHTEAAVDALLSMGLNNEQLIVPRLEEGQFVK